jgi:hypothetical protein
MAVQFPNFLNVPVRTPDYSGFGDIVNNYYAGKAMPKDDLIKAIQAQFAKPNAEQALLAAQLGNKKTGVDIRKGELEIQNTLRDIAQQKMFENQLRQALTGGGVGASTGGVGGSSGSMPTNMGANIPNIPNSPMNIMGGGSVGAAPQQFSPPSMGGGSPVGAGMPPALVNAVSQAMQSKMMPQGIQTTPNNAVSMPNSDYTGAGANTPQSAPAQYQQQSPQISDEGSSSEIVLSKGSPHLAGIDAMYDNNPLSRAFLEKKGFKKSEDIKYDTKTGKTILITKYPSGKKTVRTVVPTGSQAEENGIPLTKPVLNKVVNQIRGTDAVMPYIDKILEMGDIKFDKKGNPIGSGGKNELPHFSYLPTDAHANYQSTISEALEKYMASTGLNATDLSTKKTEEILQRHFGESTNNYLKRLHNKKKEMMEDRKRNVAMVTKGLKKYGDLSEDNSERYSSNEWEVTDGQQ